MQKFIEKYQIHITIALVLFIALGGLVLMSEQQRDKIISAQNSLKVEKQSWQREKDEMSGQISQLQKQITEVQNQKLIPVQSTATGQVAGAATQNPAISGLINLNTADLAAFDTLPGIGPAKAQTIIDYRTQKGAFKKIEDLKNVKGIGDATFQKLKPKITI